MSEEFDGWKNIDWGVEIDTLEFDIMAITSHNKTNPTVGEKWTEWPKDMLNLIILPLGYTPSKWDKDAKLTPEQEKDLKQKWIEFAQFLEENNDTITLKENTFHVKGQYGSKFSFDASTKFSLWFPPNTLERYEPSLQAIRNGARGKSNLGNHMQFLEASQATWKIDTGSSDDGLGFCDFPSHIKGLELQQYESWSTFVYPSKETFPENLTDLIEMLIADYQIWEILHEHEVKRRQANAEWNEKWPNGRPDDWMYL